MEPKHDQRSRANEAWNDLVERLLVIYTGLQTVRNHTSVEVVSTASLQRTEVSR
jgi:hypothetical protein